MLSFLKKKKPPAPEVPAQASVAAIPKTEEIKKPEKKQIFGTKAPVIQTSNPFLEKLLGNEEGEDNDKPIKKDKLGPGITCKAIIRNASGSA